MGKQKQKDDYSNLPQWIEYPHVVAADNTVEAAQQKIEFVCARCRTSWLCPSLTGEQRGKAAELWRRAQLLDLGTLFRAAGFTFAEAKTTMLHISPVPGKCHKCSRALPEDSEQVVCRCRALNLNW